MTLSYVKLQEAYASENNATGTWSAIGYKDPGAGNQHKTSSFDYSAKSADGDANKGKWQVASTVALNDCPTGSTWSVTTTYTASSGNLVTAVQSSSKANCVTPLIPNFCKIATTGDCSADGAN